MPSACGKLAWRHLLHFLHSLHVAQILFFCIMRYTMFRHGNLHSGGKSQRWRYPERSQCECSTKLLYVLLYICADRAFPDRTFCCCSKKAKVADWDTVEATPATNSWEATPGATPAAHWDATPGATPGAGSRWDATPTPGRPADGPTPRRNRWDETPTPGRVSCTAVYY